MPAVVAVVVDDVVRVFCAGSAGAFESLGGRFCVALSMVALFGKDADFDLDMKTPVVFRVAMVSNTSDRVVSCTCDGAGWPSG